MTEVDAPQGDLGLGNEEAGIVVNATEEEAAAAAAKAETTGETEVAPNWRETYLKDTDLFDNPSLATINDIPALAKAMVETKTLVGKKGVLLPGKNATPEELNTFYNALGRPETVDGYEIVKPEDMPADMPYSEERVGAFKALAHKIGLTAAQVKDLVGWQMSESLGEFKQFQESFTQVEGLGMVPKQWVEDHNKAVDTFKAELGDNYKPMMTKATIAVMKYGGQELKDLVDKTGFGDNPAMVRAWIKVAEATLTEDDLVTAQPGGMSKKDRIAALNSDPAMINETDPRHKTVVDERNKLIDEVYGDK